MKIPEDLRIGTREIELMIPEDSIVNSCAWVRTLPACRTSA